MHKYMSSTAASNVEKTSPAKRMWQPPSKVCNCVTPSMACSAAKASAFSFEPRSTRLYVGRGRLSTRSWSWGKGKGRRRSSGRKFQHNESLMAMWRSYCCSGSFARRLFYVSSESMRTKAGGSCERCSRQILSYRSLHEGSEEKYRIEYLTDAKENDEENEEERKNKLRKCPPGSP